MIDPIVWWLRDWYLVTYGSFHCKSRPIFISAPFVPPANPYKAKNPTSFRMEILSQFYSLFTALGWSALFKARINCNRQLHFRLLFYMRSPSIDGTHSYLVGHIRIYVKVSHLLCATCNLPISPASHCDVFTYSSLVFGSNSRATSSTSTTTDRLVPQQMKGKGGISRARPERRHAATRKSNLGIDRTELQPANSRRAIH